MSKATYQKFAVIGRGMIGLALIEALLAQNASVLVIARQDSSTAADSVPAGAKVASVDITNVPMLAAVLQENSIEVVISAVAQAALPKQSLLGDAAKAAGVKLFIPSEFGYVSVNHQKSVLGIKDSFAGYLQSIGLPWSRFFTGAWIQYIAWLTCLDETGKFNIAGKGDKPATWTDVGDVAGFTAHVLTTFPPEKLQYAIFRIEGESASLNEVAAMYGDKVEVNRVDGIPNDELKDFLQKIHREGKCSTGYNPETGKDEGGGSSNYLWANHRWKGIKEVLNL